MVYQQFTDQLSAAESLTSKEIPQQTSLNSVKFTLSSGTSVEISSTKNAGPHVNKNAKASYSYMIQLTLRANLILSNLLKTSLRPWRWSKACAKFSSITTTTMVLKMVRYRHASRVWINSKDPSRTPNKFSLNSINTLQNSSSNWLKTRLLSRTSMLNEKKKLKKLPHLICYRIQIIFHAI